MYEKKEDAIYLALGCKLQILVRLKGLQDGTPILPTQRSLMTVIKDIFLKRIAISICDTVLCWCIKPRPD